MRIRSTVGCRADEPEVLDGVGVIAAVLDEADEASLIAVNCSRNKSGKVSE